VWGFRPLERRTALGHLEARHPARGQQFVRCRLHHLERHAPLARTLRTLSFPGGVQEPRNQKGSCEGPGAHLRATLAPVGGPYDATVLGL